VARFSEDELCFTKWRFKIKEMFFQTVAQQLGSGLWIDRLPRVKQALFST
jgi:hypothetical protein